MRSSKLQLMAAMFIFGTIGIFRRYIPLSSSTIALVRGAVGVLFLLLVTAVQKKGIQWNVIRKNLPVLFCSGAFIGFNWILLFEAYRYTTVATATLCYYLAPIFVLLASPLLLREKLTPRKLVCIVVALIGMVCVSGVLETGVSGIAELRGILFGIGAALLYASVILLNKRMPDVPAMDRTIAQLGTAAIVLLPYTLATENFSAMTLTAGAAAMLLVVGIIHTGVAYALYFGSMRDLPTQTIAIFSYIDPVVAILLSALLLREPMSLLTAAGAVLILGSTFVSELPEKQQ